MCATKCPRWSLKWWQAGQRNGMVANENRGAGQEGSSLTFFLHTSNPSSLKKSRWGRSTMSELCRGAGLQVSRLVAGCYIAYFRSSMKRTMASQLHDALSDLRDDASTSSDAGHPSDFDAAADMVAVLASGTSLTDGLKLELYGLYKQAMCGPCCSGKPAFWDRKGRAKWSGNAQVLLLCTSHLIQLSNSLASPS